MLAFKESHVDRLTTYNLSEIALKSGFKFRDIENRRLDWKTLGCVDVNKVIENQDFEFLEKITPKIIEAPMQSILGTAALDPAVSSLFRLAQMSLQYHSFCQQFMSHTLYDLRTAFNQLQKKYSNLKQNYKCLEEQHYKAQERIQSLLSENKSEINRMANQISKPSSLFPCDQCTKNFLTAESLKSHQQRKHSGIDEKHELSDDNEKDKGKEKDSCIPERRGSLEDIPSNNANLTVSAVQKQTDNPENEISKLNNNNNDTETNANCIACSQKTKIRSASIAIQCEVDNIGSHASEASHGESKTVNDTEIDGSVEEQSEKQCKELVQSAHQTINELKKEIVELKNSLEAKTCTEAPSEHFVKTTDANSGNTNDKIEVIEQKFNAFETMYMESQHQFIESFRNLDERQKTYMDNIQETIKDIVEKSLGQQDIVTIDKDEKSDNPYIEKKGSNGIEIENAHVKDTAVDNEQRYEEEGKELPKVTPSRLDQNITIDSSSQSEADPSEFICQAEVHAVSQSELEDYGQSDKKSTKKKIRKSEDSKISKDIALNELEQRLRQFGVDADSIGLNTPRSCEVNQEIADEREEIKKAHKSFEKTRKKLRTEVDRIAKEKLASASSVTSLSSTPYHSDDQNDSQKIKTAKVRPKSASVQTMRKRNAKKLMRKFVENDIDENDILDKMQMAQKAINAHRECIQELLQTSTYSPNSLTKIKYPTSSAEKDDTSTVNNIEGNTERNSNQYNKMPNITTRRVVFVNLDEDS